MEISEVIALRHKARMLRERARTGSTAETDSLMAEAARLDDTATKMELATILEGQPA